MNLRKTGCWMAFAALMYFAVSTAAYAFRHPELTDTERFLNTIDALLWR